MTETKQGKATDRKATEAVNTIRIYCKNNDIHDCVFNCAIRQVCRGYFRNLNIPMLWPEMECQMIDEKRVLQVARELSMNPDKARKLLEDARSEPAILAQVHRYEQLVE